MSEEDKNNPKSKNPPAADPFGNQGGWGSFDEVAPQEDWGSPTDAPAVAQPVQQPQQPAAPPAPPQQPAQPAAPPVPPQQPAQPAAPPAPPQQPAASAPVPPAPVQPAAPVAPAAPEMPRQPAAPLYSPTGGASPPSAQPSYTPAPAPAPRPAPPAAPAPAPAPSPVSVPATGPAPTAALSPAYGSATVVAAEKSVSVPILLFIIFGFLVTAAFSSVVFVADYNRLGEVNAQLDVAKTRKLLLAVTDKGKIDRVKVQDEQQPEPAADGTNSARRINSITVETEASSTTVTINTDGPIAAENHFKMTDPDRLVMDVMGIRETSETNVSGDGTRLDRVRVGKHEEKVRLVFDLNYNVNVAVDKQPNKLVIRLSD